MMNICQSNVARYLVWPDTEPLTHHQTDGNHWQPLPKCDCYNKNTIKFIQHKCKSLNIFPEITKKFILNGHPSFLVNLGKAYFNRFCVCFAINFIIRCWYFYDITGLVTLSLPLGGRGSPRGSRSHMVRKLLDDLLLLEEVGAFSVTKWLNLLFEVTSYMVFYGSVLVICSCPKSVGHLESAPNWVWCTSRWPTLFG